jgi:pyruvate,orthophosphate dikinase
MQTLARLKDNQPMTPWVYRFGNGSADGAASLRDLLGGKGANLAEMSNLGLPVPPGFTITTEVCRYYYANTKTYPVSLKADVAAGLAGLEAALGCRFGDAANPLLVSVRSGARDSMPGMMDTVLNLGLNDQTVQGLAKTSNNPRFAFDSYRRFIQMYSDVVLGVDHHHFEEILEQHKHRKSYTLDTDLSADDWQFIVTEYKAKVAAILGKPFPQDVHEQLWSAIEAVFSSWMNQRAIVYRHLHGISADGGTAVNIQAMVFGNRGDDCATGVAFTRNPSTGAKELYGEFLINAQGEDVVAGIRTPQSMTRLAAAAAKATLPSMEDAMPEVFQQFVQVAATLENHFRDMQDIEFTVQHNKLWMLQTRGGKRTTAAALRIAIAMAEEGLITKEEAVRRINPASLDQLLHPGLDPKAPRQRLTKALPASPGAASGAAVFDADTATDWAKRGQAVILVRAETSPEDIHGMHAAKGILTSRGGMTSHAAVVARGMGRPCVVGATDLKIDGQKRTLTLGNTICREGDKITLDGSTGEVFLGEVPTIEPKLSGDFAILMQWADACRTLKIFTNAETPHDARVARQFGAEGIGLCRTEHMFFHEDRILAVRMMIFAREEGQRQAALALLLPMQRDDFAELFRIMGELPVMVRLLDPPLHEFLPPTDKELEEVARACSISLTEARQRSAELHETNPMLGHRGCRLGITYPEIYAMQIRAIFEAQQIVRKETGQNIIPQIMIPLIHGKPEMVLLEKQVASIVADVEAEHQAKLPYILGTMIELPRAALKAGEIAEHAAFFSFGTNDLTQTTLGLSRDDAASFLGKYQELGLLEHDPFVTLDIGGVGELIKIASERGRAARPDIKIGICGEHGGDPASIAFCQQVGMDYVSCSPYRVPIARLAAAQAALALKKIPA